MLTKEEICIRTLSKDETKQTDGMFKYILWVLPNWICLCRISLTPSPPTLVTGMRFLKKHADRNVLGAVTLESKAESTTMPGALEILLKISI